MSADGAIEGTRAPHEVARIPLPTPYGAFDARTFQCGSGVVYLALVMGDLGDGVDVLTRLHSECLTGDALSSLRCDCGIQLHAALRAIAAEGRGVLVYAIGHEGRGIGLINKLRSYAEQDVGADTLDANLRLGLVVDGRDYREGASVLRALGLTSVRLLTNNPSKVAGLRAANLSVSSVEPLRTTPHTRNFAYLRTKERRLGHVRPMGDLVADDSPLVLPAVDTSVLLGHVSPHATRPYVVLKFAQTIDGRIATSTGDSKWISGDGERRISHALRAACDAVLVGIGTVLHDDPQLTVRMVAGASPRRVVLDSTLRIPPTAKLLEPDAPTTIFTTDRSDPRRHDGLRARHINVQVLPTGAGGVDVHAALSALREAGVETLLVEGGAKVITSMLAARVVDRLVVGVAPTIIGRGTEAVGPLGISRVTDGIRLTERSLHVVDDDDVLLAWKVEPATG
jgi:GTP cyclohydrolase II